MDINLLIEPRGSKSPSPGSPSSTASYGSTNTGVSHPPRVGFREKKVVDCSFAELLKYEATKKLYPPTPLYKPTPPSYFESWLVNTNELDKHERPQQRSTSTGFLNQAPVHVTDPEPDPETANTPPRASAPNGPQILKRRASQSLPKESPVKKQPSGWTIRPDGPIIKAFSEQRVVWDEEMRNKLARLYTQYVQISPSLSVVPTRELARYCYSTQLAWIITTSLEQQNLTYIYAPPNIYS